MFVGVDVKVVVVVGVTVAVGVDGLFIETHPDPDKGPSDGLNMIPLHRMTALLEQLLLIRQAIAVAGPQPTTY